MGRNNRIEKKIDKLLKPRELKFMEDEQISKYNLHPVLNPFLDDLEASIALFMHIINVRVGCTPESLSKGEFSDIIRISESYNGTLTEYGLKAVEPEMFVYVYCSFVIIALEITKGSIQNCKIGPAEKMQLEHNAQQIINMIALRLICDDFAKYKFLKAFDHILRVCDCQNVFQECVELIFDSMNDIYQYYGK